MKFFILWMVCFQMLLFSEEELLIKNLRKAKQGDFVVTLQGKSYTLFHIYNKQLDTLAIEEVSIPAVYANKLNLSWRHWLESGAPYNTSWVIYEVDLKNGEMQNYFSYTKNGWFTVPKAESFLYNLLHLNLKPIALKQRKKLGLPPRENQTDSRPLWEPQLIIDGELITNVHFTAYSAHWPKDGSALSSKLIEIYLPPENYFLYFPYWIQVKGVLGQAQLRVIDSGSHLTSPKRYPP